MKLAFALAAVAALVVDARADCAMYGLAPKVLTPASTIVPSDGGIVVAALAEPRGKLDAGDPSVQPSWKITAGADTLKPPITTIAPGLSVYRVAMPNAFKIELHDGGTVVASVRPARGSGEKLPAPKVKKIWFEAAKGRHSGGLVTVDLDEPSPAGVVAIVMLDAKGTARSWNQVAAGVSTAFPFSSPDCVALPNGTTPSGTGDKVTLMWVAADGRTSAVSKTLTIVAK